MSKKNEGKFIGKTFGNLTVISDEYVLYPSGRNILKLNCICICGKEKSFQAGHVTQGRQTSCGCIKGEKAKISGKKRQKYPIEDIVGRKFGRLTVLSDFYKEEGTRINRYINCDCSCGKNCDLNLIRVMSGNTKSCGCGRELIAESHKHDTEEFIRLARIVHGDTYDYSCTEFLGSDVKVAIKCRKEDHGIFHQDPSNHKVGYGCSKCRSAGFRPNEKGYLYILQSANITKLGISNIHPNHRARAVSNSSKQKFEVFDYFEFAEGEKAFSIELQLLRELRSIYDNPKIKFDGYTECFIDLDPTYLYSKIDTLIKE